LRTSIGAGAVAFYVVLFIGGGQDVIAQKLDVSLTSVTLALRIGVFVVPLVTALLTYRICRDLAADDDQSRSSRRASSIASERVDAPSFE
jgi:ubiquinol-cytochrome c reductase cytochrome b subunit